MSNFPEPPKAAQNHALISRRLDEALGAGGPPETVTVELNGKPMPVGVIDVPLRDLYYNPATHRIRAQRGQKPARENQLNEDPWHAESQDYLRYLLVSKPANPGEDDPEFLALKESLREVGQREPGLVTRDGILVNGNTRAAALRDLQKSSIRVGVLPSSFTWDEINAVELALQLRPDKRRDYSYINRLLAMEEQAQMGRAAEDISREFHIKQKTFHQERWILGVIREMIDRSRTESGRQLRLVDFEGHQENLKELHRTYMNAAAISLDGAELVKEVRMAAIILDFAKTRTRLIDEKFYADYLQKTVPTSDSRVAREKSPATPASPIPGLSVTITAPSARVSEACDFTNHVLQAKAEEASADDPDDAGESVKVARETVVVARKAMKRSLDLAFRDDEIRKSQQTAAERLDDACAAIRQSIADVAAARSSDSLDEAGFDEAVIRLKSVLTQLAQQARRGLPEPGDGVAWLIAAVSEESA